MKGSKRLLCVLLAALLVLSLSGCRGFLELYERLLIHGIGIDLGEDGYVVTVRSSLSQEDEGEEYFRSQGKSVLEALNNLSLSTGREPFYSHNYLVVFGSECAKKGLADALDFFVRYYNTRPSVKLFLAKGTAEEVLSFQKEGKYLKMSELQTLSHSSRYNGKTVGMDILEFINSVKREGSCAYLPVLTPGENGVEIDSTAFFEGYCLKGFLSLTDTRGFLAVKDRIEQSEMVVSTKEAGDITLSLSSRPGKTELVFTPGEAPRFSMKAQVRADVSAVSHGKDRVPASAFRELEEKAALILQSEVESALEKSVKQARCDIFGFGNLLYRKHPEYWKEEGENWPELMAKCGYEVQVTVTAARLPEEILFLSSTP